MVSCKYLLGVYISSECRGRQFGRLYSQRRCCMAIDKL